MKDWTLASDDEIGRAIMRHQGRLDWAVMRLSQPDGLSRDASIGLHVLAEASHQWVRGLQMEQAYRAWKAGDE